MRDTLLDDLQEELEELERKLQQRDVRGNPEAVDQLLASEFREFGSSGRIWNRKDLMEFMQQEPPRDLILMQSFRVQRLAPDAALVTYVASSRTDTLRSSIWVRRDGRWQMLFHQGTKLGERQPSVPAAPPRKEIPKRRER